MTSKPSSHSDAFVEALRQNTPRAEDRERLRAALLAAGVAVGASAATSTAHAAGAQLTSATLWGKLSLLPVAVKTGICVTALAAATGIAWGAQQHQNTPPSAATARMAAPPLAAAVGAQAAVAAPSDTEDHAVELAARQQPSSEIAQIRKHRARAATRAATEAASAEQQPTAAPSQAPSTLADEAALLEQSLRALAQGQSASAQHYLDLHRQRYPQGALGAERQRAEQRLHAMNSGASRTTPTQEQSHE